MWAEVATSGVLLVELFEMCRLVFNKHNNKEVACFFSYAHTYSIWLQLKGHTLCHTREKTVGIRETDLQNQRL